MIDANQELLVTIKYGNIEHTVHTFAEAISLLMRYCTDGKE